MLKCLKFVFCCKCFKFCYGYKPLEDIDEETLLLPKTKKYEELYCKQEMFFFGSLPYDLLNNPNNQIDLSTTQLKKIVFGQEHFIIQLTKNKNELAVYGSNEEGQLGIKYDNSEKESNNIYDYIVLNKPEIVKTNKFDIIDIAANEYFSLILLKFHDTKKFLSHNYLYKLSLKTEDKINENNNTKINVFQKEDLDYTHIKIKKIYTFSDRIVLLTEDDSIYIKGSDFNMNINNKYKIFIQKFQFSINYLCLGNNHLIIFTNDKQMYVLGDNGYGELGLDNSVFEKSPVKNSFFNNLNLTIKKIATGGRHTLVLTTNGEVYAFGDNSEGQCSGYLSFYKVPIKVSFKNEEKIVDIACGYNHSIAYNEKGILYTWGDTTYGKLGHSQISSLVSFPTEVPLMEKNIIMIAGGYKQTIVVTSKKNSDSYWSNNNNI